MSLIKEITTLDPQIASIALAFMCERSESVMKDNPTMTQPELSAMAVGYATAIVEGRDYEEQLTKRCSYLFGLLLEIEATVAKK